MAVTRRRLKPWERVAALIVAAIVVALNVDATVQLFVPQNVFGYYLTYTDGYRVAAVDPGTSAARAGIEAGDHVDVRRSSLHDRLVALSYQRPVLSERVTFSVVRNGRSRPATVQAEPLTPAEAQSAAFSPVAAFLRIAGFVYIGVALVVLFHRPSRMTWGLFFYLLSATNVTFHRHPDWLTLASQFASDLLSIAGPIGLIIFAARFPSDRPKGWRYRLDRLAVPIGFLFAIPNFAWDVTAIFWGRSPAAWMSLGSTLGALVLILVSGATLIATYVRAAPQERQRLQWVIAGIVMTLCSYASGWAQYWSTTYAVVTSNWFVWIAAILYAAAPFAILYAVVRQRVFDTSFVISRTIVYTIMSALIFALFSFIEWLAGTVLERTGIAIFLLAGAAICVGFWMNAVHSRVDRFVESSFFRHRHEAEKYLARLAAGLPYAENAEIVKDAVVVEPKRAYALTSATLFRRDDGGNYVREGDGKTLDRRIPLQLQGERGSLRLHDFLGWNGESEDQAPILAIPIFVRSRLEAVVLYGAHASGEDIDPDELASLEQVCSAAGVAYDYLDSLRVTHEMSKWRKLAEHQAREIAALRERQS